LVTAEIVVLDTVSKEVVEDSDAVLDAESIRLGSSVPALSGPGMEACPDGLGSSILPVQEGFVRSNPASGPDAGDALGPDETEDVFSL